MKILLKKLKKVNAAKKITYFLTTLLYLACLIYFIISLLHLTRIETIARIIIIIFFIIWFIIYSIGGLITLLSKKTKSFIFITFISLICCPVFFVASYAIQKGINLTNQMNRNEIQYESNLIALKETSFNSSSVMGMIESEDDIAGNQLAHKLIETENLNNKIKYYEDYSVMISDLYKGKIDACFVSSEFAITFRNEAFTELKEGETAVPIEERVKVLYKYSELRQNQDIETLAASKNKVLTEPFTILVMGVDSSKDGLKANQAFNGDTLIMITFNPNTLSATMFSIPRDLYVPIACNRNRYNKINSSAAYGSSCVISTVQQLTDINIDFYVKVNFKGVVDLVDALGGVTVDVEKPDFNFNAGVNCHGQVCEQNSNREFGSKMIYLNPGVQKLNGEEALAYARNRHQYALSDISRNQHQQDVILAMAQQLKTIDSYESFENILNTVSKNIETNLTSDQILSFYDVGKNILLTSDTKESQTLSIKKTYLSYYGLTVWNGYNASALGYYQESLNAITKAMKVNLGLEKEEDIKTFKISYNEEYTTPLIGEKLYGGTKLQTLPNHVGYSKETVSTWCDKNNITCHFKAVDSASNYEQIIEQSVHANTLLKTISEVTFTYSNASLQSSNKDDNEDNNDDDDDNKDEDSNNDDDENNDNEDKNNEENPKPSENDNTDNNPTDIIVPSPDDQNESE